MSNIYVRQAGSWSVATTWSATGWGGAAAAAAPLATDDCIFGADATGIVTVNSATLCLGKSVTFNSANNRVVFTAAMILQLSGAWNTTNFDMTGIVSGTGTLQLKVAATSYVGAFPGALQFNLAATFVMGNNWTITGLVTSTLATVLNNDGTAKTLTCNGGLTCTTLLSGSALCVIGGGTWSGAGGLGLATTFLNSPVIETTGYRNLTLSKGAGTPSVTAATTLTLLAACTLDTNGINFVNVTTTASSVALSSNFNITGVHLISSLSPTYTGAGHLVITGTGTYRQIAATAASILTLPDAGNLDIAGKMDVIGTQGFAPTIKSTTGGQHTHLNYTGTAADMNVCRAIFTDVDASGSNRPIDNWNGGSISGSTNIVNITSATVDATEASLAAEIILYDAEVVLYNNSQINLGIMTGNYNAEVVLYNNSQIALAAMTGDYNADINAWAA